MSAEKLTCPATGRECLSSDFCHKGIDLQDDEDKKWRRYPLPVSEGVRLKWNHQVRRAAESEFCMIEREAALIELAGTSPRQWVRITASGLAENIKLARLLHRDRG